MNLNPYLTFDGLCAEAFSFYARCLGGEITFLQTYGDAPMAAEMPLESHERIMHAQLTIGDRVLMGSDAPPRAFEKPQGFSISIGLDDPHEAERIFAALAEDGIVRMPIQETFWALRFGMLVDRFGTPWMINCEAKAPA